MPNASAIMRVRIVFPVAVRVLLFFFFSSRRRHTRLVSDWSSDVCSSDLEAFGYLKRVIVTPAVYPRFIEFLHFDIQSTGQKSHRVNTRRGPSRCFVLIKQSEIGRASCRESVDLGDRGSIRRI